MENAVDEIMKDMFKSLILERKITEKDEGTMGFHTYVKNKEDFGLFVSRVNLNAEKLAENNKIISISYASEDVAVITYRGKKKYKII